MNLNLSGRNALVCGSTQGIGKAAAIELAMLGANVTLLARDESKLKLTVEALPRQAGQQHHYAVADFNFPDQLKNIVQSLASERNYHVLINNTGGPPGGAAIDASLDEYVKAFSAHLLCNQI